MTDPRGECGGTGPLVPQRPEGPLAYVQNVLASLSHVLNAVLGGSARNSFSARAGKAQARGEAWARIVGPAINLLLFSRNHCIERAVAEGLIANG